MKKLFSFVFGFMALVRIVSGQEIDRTLIGEVTFVTSQNIYVRFADTDLISVGDSLQLQTKSESCLIITSKSTTSCVCEIVNGCSIEKGDAVTYTVIPKKKREETETVKEELTVQTSNLKKEEPFYKEDIRGRISVSSQNIIASNRDDRHRFMGRLSLNADHIKNSKFSFNTYLNYRQILNSGESSSVRQNSLFRVYNLAAHYEVLPSMSVTFGRNINPKISSLGAIDGLQAEKYFGKKYIGAIVGFRPDIFDFGFNSNLLQYGGYVGIDTNSDHLYSQTTLGFIQQKNSGEIDRRYAYFQHNSTLFKNFNVFSSLEVDLFSKLNNEVSNDIRLTNLYVSARYRFNRKLNMSLSYDSRKRILYYETFQTDIERLLDDDIARQGARARINFRPSKGIMTGASYSKRFQNNSENKSDNINGFVTFSKIPNIGGRLSLSYNRNESNYLLSNIGSVRYFHDFLRGRLSTNGYYRFVHYDYVNMLNTFNQHYMGVDVSYNITRKLLFGISVECTIYNQENNIRIFSRLIQRF